MKTNCLAFMLFLAGALCAVGEELDYARLIERSAQSLDQLLNPEGRGLVARDAYGRGNRQKLPPVDRTKLVPVLAYMLNMPEEMLRKTFVDEKHRLSDILFARHLAEKQARPFEKVLRKEPIAEWIKQMRAANISLKEVSESFDDVYAHVALRALDL